MKAPKPVFVCQECGSQAPKWQGRCPDCGAWNSFVEERAPEPSLPGGAGGHRYAIGGPSGGAVRYAEIEAHHSARLSSGIDEFDRVLGGGIVPGSLVLLGGEPGIGKSTLLLQATANFAHAIGPVLYASGEESEQLETALVGQGLQEAHQALEVFGVHEHSFENGLIRCTSK